MDDSELSSWGGYGRKVTTASYPLGDYPSGDIVKLWNVLGELIKRWEESK